MPPHENSPPIEEIKSLGETLKKLRKSVNPPVTITALASATGFSISYLSQIETGQKCPDVNFARQIAAYFYRNETAQLNLFRDLLKKIIILKYPESVDLFDHGEIPDSTFIMRLHQDFVNSSLTSKDIAKIIGKENPDITEWIFKGLQPLSRNQIFVLAKALGQPPLEYLLLAGYLPYECLELLTNSPLMLKALGIASQI